MAAEVGVSLATVVDAARSAGIDVVLDADTDPDTVVVSSITHDSRVVRDGSLFVCLPGSSFDGHDFAASAVTDGATALLVERRLADVGDVAQLVVADARVAAGPIASAVYADPSHRLDTVGITGTNGKTTTTQMLASVLERCERPTGVVGTLHGPRTTPEATELQAMLSHFVEEARRCAVMEVSSHALALHRVDGTRFDVVAFTNFGHDHLDLHGSPEAYFRAKSVLFDVRFAPVAVINVDDPHGRLLADTVADRIGDEAMEVVEVSVASLDAVEVGPAEHRYRWRGHDVVVPIGGDVNVANSQMALTIATRLGVDEADAVAAIAEVPSVPGRFERVDSAEADRRGISVIVDYAHTPDGLEQLLMSARNVAGDGRVVAVFGCGGERDREKRPGMGRVASRLADHVVVTSDNPRREDPSTIIDEIVAGTDPAGRAVVATNSDRRGAIADALALAAAGDLVVVAGKGHETTQDLGDRVVDFDDREVARRLLADTTSDPAAAAGSPTDQPDKEPS